LPSVAPTICTAVDRQHDLGLRIVPGRVAAHADRHAGALRRQQRRLGEHLGVRADAHLEVLAPQATRLQCGFQCRRLRRARLHFSEIGADRGLHVGPHAVGTRRITLGLLLDHALEQAGRERHASGLDHLQIDRRQQMRHGGVALRAARVAQDVGKSTEAVALKGFDRTRRIGFVEQIAHRREALGQVEHALLAHRHHRRAGVSTGQPAATDQRAGSAVVGQAARGVEFDVGHASLQGGRESYGAALGCGPKPASNCSSRRQRVGSNWALKKPKWPMRWAPTSAGAMRCSWRGAFS
jgi:hypothetical protein